LKLKIQTHHILIVASIIVFLISNIIVLKVPTFADGTQHTWISDYVCQKGNLPKDDITGTQSSNLLIARSIKDPNPFVYQPLFYETSGSLCAIIGSASTSIVILDIISILLTGIFIALIAYKLFSKNVATLAFIFILASNVWPWLIVHRLVEPVIILFSAAAFFSLMEYLSGKKNYLYLIILFIAILFGLKQSVYPILISIFLGIFIKRKQDFIIAFFFFILLTLPFVFFNVSRLHALTPIKTGVNIIDSSFKNAWWNQQKATWEVNLDKDANTPKLRENEYAQFKNAVQRSPSSQYRDTGIVGTINEFSLYPISRITTEGYQSVVASKLAPLFLLLATFGLFLILKTKELFIRYKTFFICILVFYITTAALWIKQPVFRYYIYILPFSSIIYAVASIYILEKVSISSLKYIFVTTLLIFIPLNLYQEVERDLAYAHTAMHRTVPNNQGGLNDSISFANKIRNNDNSSYVFTPMVEIAYYERKRYLWDDRLFFINNRDKLIEYLDHYDFSYVVLPFYSGSTNLQNWVYYEGVPSDSTFNKLLKNPKYFHKVESNNTFTAYKRVR
jgi:hypothetical protein